MNILRRKLTEGRDNICKLSDKTEELEKTRLKF